MGNKSSKPAPKPKPETLPESTQPPKQTQQFEIRDVPHVKTKVFENLGFIDEHGKAITQKQYLWINGDFL